jgi:hypothetical protein
MKIKACLAARFPSKSSGTAALCSSGIPLSTRRTIMKCLFLAIAAGMLSACVSAPSDLYGIHQAKPEAPAAPAKQMAATGHQQ